VRRRLLAAAAVVLAGMALAVAAEPAGGVTPSIGTITLDGLPMQHLRVPYTHATVTGTGPTRSDFDGDGIDDVTASGGAADYTGLPYTPTSVVVVRYSSAQYRDYLVGGRVPNGGASLRDLSLAAGDFNADGFDDLVIGDGYEDLRADLPASGGVWVVPGSGTGLRVDAARHLTQDSPGMPGACERYDRFGAAVAAGDINGDGRDDLAVGAPGEGIGTKRAAGGVAVVYGGSAGLTTSGAKFLHQDLASVPGAAEADDYFGGSVAIGRVNGNKYADLVIGAPLENSQSPTYKEGDGMVTLMWGSSAGVSSTGATSVTGNAAARAAHITGTYLWALGMTLAVTDTNGDGLGEVIAGAPSAEVAWKISPGALVSFVGRSSGLATTGLRVISQATSGVPGTPEAYDRFGRSLAAGDVNGDGRGDLLVGIPQEDLGSVVDAGGVTLLFGSPSGLTGTGAKWFDQGSAGVPGVVEAHDQFGFIVAMLNLNGRGGWDAAVTTPGEEVTGDTAGYPSGAVTTFVASGGTLAPQASWSGRSLATTYFRPDAYGWTLARPSTSLYE
jgi:hypothetical protein